MQIDWLTVAAQIVNFLVLVWLLQHFLYGPITRAMARREQRIADRLREAAEKKEEAEAEARAYRERQHDLEERRERLLADARREAEKDRKSLEGSAREEVGRRRKEWLSQLEAQREGFLRDLGRRTTDRFLALSRRALAQLGNAELESQIAGVFVERLKALEPETRKRLAAACKDAGGHIVVSSHFEPSAEDKRRITRAIHEEVCADAEVDYRRSEEIACGVELRAGSQTVSWSFDAYFDSLREELAEEIRNTTEQPEG